MTKLSNEDKRLINNKLTHITLASDRMMAQRDEIYKLVKEIKDILSKNEQNDKATDL